MENWSNLPDGPLGKIADYLLDDEEYVDAYAVCRRVCGNWRRALQEPEIYLNNWILIDHTLPDIADFTFLDIADFTFFNLVTGRCFTTNLIDVQRR